MNILRCHVRGFGRLSDLNLAFKDGLNLVFAPNEAGKTTLQRFLVAMLYGQLRPDLKTQRRMEAWVENCRPWQGSEYGGAFWCRLVNGRELEVRRGFGRDESRVEILTAAGEDITREYEYQRNGEVLFARTHFGLPKELFESVAVIRENLVAELNGRDTIRDRIANLAQSGDEELSVRLSLEKLESALEAIGSERAPTRPYRVALDRLEELQGEKKGLETRRADFQLWLDERARLGGETARLERGLKKAQATVLTARLREAEEKVRLLEELDGEVQTLRREIERSEGRPEFPAHLLEELNGLVGARESLDLRMAESRKEMDAIRLRLQNAQKERDDLGAYANLQGIADTDKVTEWFVKYLNTSVHRDSAQRSISLIREESQSLLQQLSGLGAAFEDPETDWLLKAMEAADAERKGSSESLGFAEKIAAQKTEIRASSGRVAKFRAIGVVLFLAALGIPAAWRFLYFESIPPQFPLSLGGALAIGSILMLRMAATASRDKAEKTRAVASLQAEQARVREASQKPQRDIESAMEAAGYKSVEDFLAAAKQAEQWRQKLLDLEARAKDADRQRERMHSECAELFTRIQDLLGKVGLSCSPGTVKSKVDLFRASLKEFRAREAACRECLQACEKQSAQEAQLQAEAAEKQARIDAILSGSGVDSIEAFREACASRQRRLDLNEREASRTREFQRLCGSRTLEEWKLDLREIESRKAQFPAEECEEPAGDSAPGLLFLPYQPTVPEAEQREREAAALLAAAREEHARIVERVRQAFHNYREISEIEEDLALIEQTVRDCERNRKSLEIAMDAIRLLSREQQEVLAPQLNLAVEQRFLRLCQGRYREVKIDPDFEVRLREDATGELRKSTSLSRGTQDQLYFAMRFGILDLVSNPEEPCPCLLDEPFAAYDRSRMLEAFEILREEAARRQLVLFTCREDLRGIGELQGAHVVDLAV